MSTYQDDKKHINVVSVDLRIHNTLLELASNKGLTLREYAGHALKLYVDGLAKEHETSPDDPPEVRMYWTWIRAENAKNLREKVYRTAAIYNEHQTEAGADALRDMCDLSGMDYVELLARVGKDPFSSIVAESRGTKYGACLQWLSNLLNDHSDGLAAKVIQKLAEKEGYNSVMLNRAKRGLNEGDTQVISVKRGMGWYWVVDTVDEENEEDHDHEDRPIYRKDIYR